MTEPRLFALVTFCHFMFLLNLSQCVFQLLFVVCVFCWLSSANKNFVTSYHILHFILAANLVDNLRTLTLKLLSRNLKFYLQNEQCGNLIFRKIIKFVATICQILRLKCTKFKFGWRSAPDPAGGAYSAPPDPLAGFKGSYF